MRSKIENIVEVLKNIDNEVYVVGHKNADMDSLCSSLALTYLLKKLGKSAKALVEKKDIDKLKYFNFDENITSIISSSDYTIILVDANRISRLNSCFEEYYKNAKVTINIDHHNGNDTNADYILSVEDISSTCEIIYNLCEEMKIEIDKLMAEFLFVGIISDTDLFYNRTNQKTLSIASSLVSKKIDNKYLIHEFYLKKVIMK